MSTYGRITPYFLNSTLPDRSSNLLPTPDNEDFTVVAQHYEANIEVPEWTAEPVTYAKLAHVSLSGWRSGVSYGSVTDFVPFVARVKNTGDNHFWIVWVPLDDNTVDSTGSQYTTVLPGMTVVLHARADVNQYAVTAWAGSLVMQMPMNSGSSTAEVTVLQLDAQTIIDELG